MPCLIFSNRWDSSTGTISMHDVEDDDVEVPDVFDEVELDKHDGEGGNDSSNDESDV